MFGIGAWLAETALMKSPIVGGIMSFLKAIPKPVWEALTVIAYVLALLFLHQHYANAAIKAAYDKGYAKATADIKAEEAHKTAEVVAITNEGDGQSVQANRGIDIKYAPTLDHINATADRLRSAYQQRRAGSVAGPGVHALPDTTAGATGAVSGGSAADDGLGSVDQPGQEGSASSGSTGSSEPTITVPALKLIDYAQTCDTEHVNNKKWWDWWNANEKIYQDWVAKVQKAAQPETMDIKPSP